jgi:hypothetical protein
LRVFEKRVLRRILGPNREGGEDCLMRRIITCALYRLLLGWSNQGGWDGLGILHEWGRWQIYTKL